jgi:hypothetical protein
MTDVQERDDDVEPPPYGGSLLSAPYAAPIAFGSPPEEPVELEAADLPWELREEVPIADGAAGGAAGQPRDNKGTR